MRDCCCLYLHGGDGSGSSSAGAGTDYLWQKLADRVSVITIFPEGEAYALNTTSKPENGCCGNASGGGYNLCTDYNDVKFLRDVVSQIYTDYNSSVDLFRVYVASESQESIMAYCMVLEVLHLVV